MAKKDDNLTDFGDGSDAAAALTPAQVEQTAGAQGPSALAPSVERVWIQLEDSAEIAPTGQFFGCNGRSYIIRPGEPVHVPKEVVEVLQDAVMSVPIQDENQNVIGWRDRLRFPFRYVSAPRIPVAA